MGQLAAEPLNNLIHGISFFYEELDDEVVGVGTLCLREELSLLPRISFKDLEIKDHGFSVPLCRHLDFTVLFDH